MDNGAFAKFDQVGYERMLDRYIAEAPPLFVTAPDIVGDASGTLRLFAQWQPRLRRYPYPIAFVAQDVNHRELCRPAD